MKSYSVIGCLLTFSLFLPINCMNNNINWDGGIIVSSPLESDNYCDIEVKPNFELELVTVLPVRNESVGLSVLSFAVDKQGFIYVGERGEYGWDDKERKYVGYNLPEIVKIAGDGKIVSQIKGSIPDEYECAERNVSPFLFPDDVVPDSEGFLYINDYGNILVCAPGRIIPERLNVSFDYESAKTDISLMYNWETGGVIVKDREKRYAELKGGRVIKDNLPKYYGCDTLYYNDMFGECVLVLTDESADMYGLQVDFSDDLENIEYARLSGLGTFKLDLKRQVYSVQYVGYNINRIFVVQFVLEPGQVFHDRLIYFYGGHTGYAGHIVPPYNFPEQKMLIGEDEKYYEFGFIFGKKGLHIFRAKEIPKEEKNITK